jgi:hypothetical protein
MNLPNKQSLLVLAVALAGCGQKAADPVQSAQTKAAAEKIAGDPNLPPEAKQQIGNLMRADAGGTPASQGQ